MPAKLHINLSQGVLDVEGEESFVKTIYEDFREEALKNFSSATRSEQPITPASHLPSASASGGSKKKATIKKTSGSKGKFGKYKPKFKSNLDLSQLETFYNQFSPKNHSEKILIFAEFLSGILKISPCVADDIFSCYFSLKGKTATPQAFVQSLRDAQNQKGYIEFNSLEEINITIAGNNHFNQGLKKNSGD